MYNAVMRTGADALLRDLRAVERGVEPARLRPIVGRSGRNVTQQHLREYDSKHPNRLKGRRTHFYAAAARATHFRELRDGVVIVVSKPGIFTRYNPGKTTIRPVNARRLAIPATARAHGRLPGEFNDLELFHFRRKDGSHGMGLRQRQQQRISYTRRGIKRGGKLSGKVFYWLVESVTQQGDPNVMPSEAKVGIHVTSDLTQHVNRILARRQGANK